MVVWKISVNATCVEIIAVAGPSITKFKKFPNKIVKVGPATAFSVVCKIFSKRNPPRTHRRCLEVYRPPLAEKLNKNESHKHDNY